MNTETKRFKENQTYPASASKEISRTVRFRSYHSNLGNSETVRLQQVANESVQAKNMGVIQQMVDSSVEVKRSIQLQALASLEHQPNQDKVVQRTVIFTPGYDLRNKRKNEGWTDSLKNKAYNGWERLDMATFAVKEEVDKKIDSGKVPQTKHWATYIKHPSARSYGYLVEEGLNTYARQLGWATQVRLEGARPDFARKLGGKWIMADLTTTAQSKGAGMHLNDKLDKSNLAGVEYVAGADITYDREGLSEIPIIPSRQDCIAIHDRIFKDRDDSDYDPKATWLRKNLPSLPELTNPDPDVWQDWLDSYEYIVSQYSEDDVMSYSSDDY